MIQTQSMLDVADAVTCSPGGETERCKFARSTFIDASQVPQHFILEVMRILASRPKQFIVVDYVQQLEVDSLDYTPKERQVYNSVSGHQACRHLAAGPR